MNRLAFQNLFGTKRPVLGMIHLPPLPGAPNYTGSMTAVMEHALQDAETLVQNGINGLIVENLGDYPYYPFTIEPETVASMTKIAFEVRKHYEIPLGINVLRNSWKAALAIAMAVDAQFIRLNILTDTLVTDQGIINGEAYRVMRYRKMIQAEHVLVFSDLYSKHAGPLVKREIEVVANEMVERGMADVLIVSGPSSAIAPEPSYIKRVREAVPDTPVILGSGITAKTYSCVSYADGTIFGYGTKPSGNMNDLVDGETVREVINNIKKLD